MRVLLINELYSMGGSEIQTLREKTVLRANGHDVWHITFDRTLDYEVDPEDSQHINLAPVECINIVDRIKDKFYKWAVVDKHYKKILIQQIETICPDIIHLNVNNYKQITLYEAVKNYACVQTIRDFSAVCPSRMCVDREYKTCRGYCYGNCIKNCMPQQSVRSKLRFWLLKWNIKRVNKFRLEAIDVNLCPSKYLTDICNKNGIPTNCLNNSFDFSILDDFVKKNVFDHKIYLVYGIVAEHKGTRQIVEAFDTFSKGKDVELHIAGKILDDFKDEFEKMIVEKEKIRYLGKMSYKNIIKYLEGIYSVIVPSLWLENYPNTALEGLATRCLVLGSDRGGIPELVQDDRFTFDILNLADVIEKLEISYQLDEQEYQQIVQDNFERIKKNNGIDAYFYKIINIFENLERRDA